MGDMADYYGVESPEAVDVFAAQCHQQDVDRCYRDGVWVTRDGRRIPVTRMEDAHLVNTLRMLQRNAEKRRMAALLPYLGQGPIGEFAQDCFDMESRAVSAKTWRDFVSIIFDKMEREAAYRNLIWSEIKDEAAWALGHDLQLIKACGERKR